LACGACSWLALNQAYLRSSPLLDRTQLLLLEAPPIQAPHSHQAHAAYQHLYQEKGFAGYYHGTSSTDSSRTSGVATAGPTWESWLAARRQAAGKATGAAAPAAKTVADAQQQIAGAVAKAPRNGEGAARAPDAALARPLVLHHIALMRPVAVGTAGC
jgi:hypothetical protein